MKRRKQGEEGLVRVSTAEGRPIKDSKPKEVGRTIKAQNLPNIPGVKTELALGAGVERPRTENQEKGRSAFLVLHQSGPPGARGPGKEKKGLSRPRRDAGTGKAEKVKQVVLETKLRTRIGQEGGLMPDKGVETGRWKQGHRTSVALAPV